MSVKEEVFKVIESVLKFGRIVFVEYEVKQVLKVYSLFVLNEKFVKIFDEVLEYVEEIGYFVVMKFMLFQIFYKSDVKVVIFNIKFFEELKQKWEEIYENVRKYCFDVEIFGVFIVLMFRLGREIIIGVIEDLQFGYVIMFGFGGIFVEVFKDVIFRIILIIEKDVRKMIVEIKGYLILVGVCGEELVDIDVIVDMFFKVFQFVDEFRDYIKEMDFNFVFVYEKGKGVVVVDVRIIVKVLEKKE